MASTATAFSALFTPLRIGSMELANRIMVPTHAMADGNLLGTQAEADRFIAYYRSKADGGAAWVCGSSMHLRTHVPAGFEPSGMGASLVGSYRHPLFVERAGQFAAGLHEGGAKASMQMIFMGGTPHGPGEVSHGYFNNMVSHALSRAEIAQVVAEYAWSAEQAAKAGLDGLELHGNNDDLLQWFMSPLTNTRSDRYGGSAEKRLTLLFEVLGTIRNAVGPQLTLGARLCMDERIAGGYAADEAREAVRQISSSGLVDYLHLNVGNNWGETTYLPSPAYPAAEWAAVAATMRAVSARPVIYTGRVTTPAQAERIVLEGQADVVGIVRATIADPQFVAKAARGAVKDIRPCVTNNDCLNRVVIDGIGFSCAVNPRVGSELAVVPAAHRARSVLVIGGGPAGMEAAACAAERGHDVTVWEAADHLGGQLCIAARMPGQHAFADYVDFQRRRLDAAGVRVDLGHRATGAEVNAAGADAVVVATGARPHIPAVVGINQPNVVGAGGVLLGQATVGQNAVIVIEEDHMAPLGVADFLALRGHRLTLVYRTPEFAPLVGRYNMGNVLARLFAAGVTLIPMHRLAAIAGGCVTIADIYGGSETVLEGVDSVVLACGARAENALHEKLVGQVTDLHLIGDAYAPRRLTFATRQGDAVGRAL